MIWPLAVRRSSASGGHPGPGGQQGAAQQRALRPATGRAVAQGHFRVARRSRLSVRRAAADGGGDVSTARPWAAGCLGGGGRGRVAGPPAAIAVLAAPYGG